MAARKGRARKAVRGEIEVYKTEGIPKGKPARIREIRRLMAHGQWVTGITGPELAKAWDVSAHTIAKDASEASRRQREDVFDREEMRALLIAELQVCRTTSLRRGRTRDAIEALKTIGHLLGLHSHTIEHEMRGEMTKMLEAVRGVVDDATFDRIVAAVGGGGEEGQD